MKNSLRDYFELMERLTWTMASSWNSNEKRRLDSELAYHHWLNQDDIEVLRKNVEVEVERAHQHLTQS